MKLTDDLYAYEWTDYFENNCNSFYIGGNIGALVDPGLTKYVPDLLEKMAQDGIETKGIRYIINTHSHPDHFEGSEYFYDQDIQIALNKEELDFLQGPGGELYGLFGLATPQAKIDLFLAEGLLTLGDEEFQVLHVSGHSPGSIALYWPRRKTLFPGDVIFNQNVGRTDFPGGNGSLLKKSISKLSALDVEWLLPGHMEIIKGANNVKNNFKTVVDHIFPYI
ncbi:MAG: MBL fold metallo-hydrolase [Deltaproteobacteria bacterium]|nr:MBL fold metallo-hydrolase [Deltaproteobacteria bacterium]